MNPTTIRFRLLRAALALAINFALALSAQAQTFKVLHAFSGDPDGGNPRTGVLLDSAGNLYGATSQGGNLKFCDGFGCGVVYKLSPVVGGAWQETALIRFRNSATGAVPSGALFLDSAGNLFGADGLGGTSSACGSAYNLSACGLVFELSPDSTGWQESTPLILDGGNGGTGPYGGLIADAAGNLYGATYSGGDPNTCQGFGCGTVYRLSSDGAGGWQQTVLYSFTGGADGRYPGGPVIFDAAGNLYGVTSAGGNTGCAPNRGCGVVFKLSPTPSGLWNETVLHTFNGRGDGGVSEAGLVFDPAGNLYGATTMGGNLTACGGSGCGNVFELSPTSGGGWLETPLHTFTGKGDGSNVSGLIFDPAGNLYGVAYAGGGNLTGCGGAGCGLVFKLSPKPGGGWQETALHFFSGGQDGAGPAVPLTIDAVGNLYGTTLQGGISNDGVVFKITP